ncbi:MAG TPA: ATP-binding protein [Polyangiaceae bacterium]|nr:ATP-binding protein [Polyangiaceae bacterium]
MTEGADTGNTDRDAAGAPLGGVPDGASSERGGALTGGGELGALIRAMDWSKTPLGPISSWPQSLKTSVSLILNSQHPMWIGWGREATFLYNDAYVQVLSLAKHPWALGRPFVEVWSEIWDVCGPLAAKVFERGEATFMEDVRLFMNRGDFIEETYYSFSYSPIRDESGAVGGLFCPSAETTSRVLNARRLRTLSALSAGALAQKSTEAAYSSAEDTLAENPDDVPFALLYLVDESASTARRQCRVGLRNDPLLAPDAVPLGARATDAVWPIADVVGSGQTRVVSLPAHPALPRDPAGQPVTRAVVLPLVSAGGNEAPSGVLIAAVNPARKLDAEYLTFYDLIAGQVARAIQNARSVEEEKRRADALAELDRAKTMFFSNISHEFRTPLTLMLGPTEEALYSTDRALRGVGLETVHRNALRLLKLVNTLLDFSRLEAGRVQARFEAVDLAGLTVDLASGFRSAMERGGLAFEVDCPPLPAPVPVDRDMWEKIVLNLLSNALKFTFEGSVRVTLRSVDGRAVLEVSDTGVGIPEHELPKLFDRFHRIEGSRSRTHEGSGIGLALVRDLVRLHHGELEASSRVGQGSTFRVSIPTDDAVLGERSPDTTEARPKNTAAYVQEALRWVPAPRAHGTREVTPAVLSEDVPHVLVADDNADMREYLERLLRPRFCVEVVADGAEALEAARRRRPDLVLADAMMPNLDGFALMRALRSDSELRTVPIIMVSARAGEEARVEGVEGGADDYLVKPFSARELLARVATQIELGRLRRMTELEGQRLQTIFAQAPIAIALVAGPEMRFVLANDTYCTIAGSGDIIGKTLSEAFPELPPEHETFAAFRRALAGEALSSSERLVRLVREGRSEDSYWTTVWQPVRKADGRVSGVVVISTEVTDAVQARRRSEALGASLEQANRALEGQNRDAIAAREEAEQANRMKDEFLATVSHELRTPLNAVLGWATLLRTGHRPDAERERALATIERNARALARLVEDILDVSRIISGKLRLDVRRVELASVVQSAIDVVRPAAEAKQLSLRVQLGEEPETILGDPDRIQQIIWNLLSNAVRFTPVGGHIDLSTEVHNGQLVLSVQDSGMGIAAEHLPHVFERFRQVDSSTTRKHGGLGLGLAIVRHLVELHGGSVRAESPGIGQGTRFTVSFPMRRSVSEAPSAARSDVSALVATPEARRVSLAGRSILVVDDEVDSRDIIAAALEGAGARVKLAASADEALEAVRANAPEILISDIGMPVHDGNYLIQRVRSLPADQGGALPAIALTAYARQEDADRSLSAGYQMHLAKPFDVASLVSAVARLLAD